ncbi:MAG: amidohydrolase family protein, partial [Candidatus Eremiobacterota bacterium]
MTRLYTGASFYTMDVGGSVASALAVANGRILAVGREEEVRARLVGPVEEVPLPGRAVLPGFIDPHHHFAYALFFEAGVDLSPRKVRTLDQVVDGLRAAAAALPEGAWVVGFGYDEWRLAERRPPTRDVLDRACPHHPVLVSQFTGHEACVNSLALQYVEGRDPWGGKVERDRSGRPTGRLIGTALRRPEGLARRAVVNRNLHRFPDFLGKYEERLFRVGITRIHDPVVPPDLLELYRYAVERKRLRLPCVVSPLAPGAQLDTAEEWLDHGQMGEGSELLRIGPAKFILDGAERCHLCLSPYQLVFILVEAARRAVRNRSLEPLYALARVRPSLTSDLKLQNGPPYLPLERSLQLAHEAVARGYSLMIHAIGSEAADQAVWMVNSVRRRHPLSVPPRIEHGLFMRPATIRRAADLGCLTVTQPDFVLYASLGLVPAIPPGMRYVGNRSILEAGGRIA